MNKFEATATARENGWDGWGGSMTPSSSAAPAKRIR